MVHGLFRVQVCCPAVWARIGVHVGMHVNYAWHTREWIASHRWTESHHPWLRHVTHVNYACHTREWIVSHKWTESYHTCMRYVTNVNGPCQMYQFVTSHMWMHYSTDAMSRMLPRSVDLCIKMVRDSFVTHTYVLTHWSWAMCFPWCLDLWMCFPCGVSIDRST